jgi:hypothetical protein
MLKAHNLRSTHSAVSYPKTSLMSNMDFELHPQYPLRAVVQRSSDSRRALHCHAQSQSYHPAIQGSLCHRQLFWHTSRLHRRFTEPEIRRGFTTLQLMTVLAEACHGLIIVEHDPLLYEDSAEMVERHPMLTTMWLEMKDHIWYNLRQLFTVCAIIHNLCQKLLILTTDSFIYG